MTDTNESPRQPRIFKANKQQPTTTAVDTDRRNDYTLNTR